jgi:hypothetical protein
VSEAVYQHILPCGRVVDASLYRRPSLDPRPAVRATAGASTCSQVESTVRLARHRRCTHTGVATSARRFTSEPASPSDPTTQTANSNVAKLPPSTLSVGYTDAADGCPPMTPACQRKQTASALDSQPGMLGQRGSRSGLHRDVAAAGSIPADPTEQEARVLPERRACRSDLTSHKCSALSWRCTSGPPKEPRSARNLDARTGRKPPLPT